MGDLNVETTFTAIGRALTQWERFEYQLSGLFAVLVGAAENNVLPASRAYGSVVTFNARTAMVKAAADAFFLMYPNVELSARVMRVLKEAGEFAQRRNEIAHGVVKVSHWPFTKETGSAQFPSDYATSKNRLDEQLLSLPAGTRRFPTYIYTSVEIGAFEKEFGRLAVTTSDLWSQVAAYRKSCKH